MSKRKIINDPIYGLIAFPYELIYDIIDHPYFQRLRRISQMGLSTYVYPGANHSRFSHALGALHLMTTALDTLKAKDIEISEDEYLGACLAILLHDVGHGPFSHALEHLIVDKTHEDISLDIMDYLNKEYQGQLAIAISIFKGQYPKKFLGQLVSSQLDMDRMDYLTRDSYYSGVAEGVIGYKRIISMLNVRNDELVVEEKGVFSIEKFIVARYIMYWQVYLHKASIASEQMLRSFVIRYKDLVAVAPEILEDCRMKQFYIKKLSGEIDESNYLEKFITLDDIDIYNTLKICMLCDDFVLRTLAKGIINRKLFKVQLQEDRFTNENLDEIKSRLIQRFPEARAHVDHLILQGNESSKAYDNMHQEIQILSKDGTVKPVTNYLDVLINVRKITKYYVCYPKLSD